jgi:hypothetical protein
MAHPKAPTSSDAATLTVHRTSPADMQERELYVSVDRGKNTILRYGDSVTVTIAAGHHTIRVHNTLSRRHAAFEAAPGEQIVFQSANVRGKGFAMLAIFFGIAPMHTSLERVA